MWSQAVNRTEERDGAKKVTVMSDPAEARGQQWASGQQNLSPNQDPSTCSS